MAPFLSGMRRNLATVILLCRDKRTPKPVKIAAACCVGYVFSPIQLIPDWIPVVGLLDDVVMVSLGLTLLLKLTPPEVVRDCRERAMMGKANEQATTPPALAMIATIGLWLLIAVVGSLALMRIIQR
jgi:uncharacterized membrane protein YkvA (DUF1232 family)